MNISEIDALKQSLKISYSNEDARNISFHGNE